MKFNPQFRLRTIFATFVCIAVALTVGTSAQPVTDAFGFYTPQLNWHFALLSAASTAMIFGLMEQSSQLVRGKPGTAPVGNGYKFARKFAVVWRLIIAVILAICMMATVLTSRGVVTLPEQVDVFLFDEIFPGLIWTLCVVIVLSASVARWKHGDNRIASLAWRTRAAWILGVALAVLVLPGITEIVFLVHIATSGIELAIPKRFGRSGVFPDHKAEGFRTFWISIAAVASIAVAAATLVLINQRSRDGRARRILLGAIFAATLVAAAGFCVWYYGIEFHRISPDLASVGPAANWLAWLSGGMLAAMMITVGARRLARMEEMQASESIRERDYEVRPSFHEYFLSLLLPIGAILIYRIEILRLVL